MPRLSRAQEAAAGHTWRTNYLIRDTPIRSVIPCLRPITAEDFFAYADARIDLALSMSNGAFASIAPRAVAYAAALAPVPAMGADDAEA
jgi:hypothetical protein